MNNYNHQLGDTTLTKVFVGGLAWETQKDAVKEHFDHYGEILEAVIICDKLTGRSKGYGFVTFKEAEAARKACEDASPVINGRRANCNLASLGARRPKSLSTTPQKGGASIVLRSISPAPVNQVQWYYPATATRTAVPLHHHQQHITYPHYGYNPTYITTDMSYNPVKLNYNGGSYMNGNYSQAYGGQGMMPIYPYYQLNQQQIMGVPTHIYPSQPMGPMTTIPTIITKPPTMAPNAGSWIQVKVLQGVPKNSYMCNNNNTLMG